MTTFSYLETLRLVLPEVVVVITALCVLSVDLLFLRTSETRTRISIGTTISLAGCAISIAWILRTPQYANVLDGMLVLNEGWHFLPKPFVASKRAERILDCAQAGGRQG